MWIWFLIVYDGIDIVNADILSTLFLYSFHEGNRILEGMEHNKNYFTSLGSFFIGMT